MVEARTVMISYDPSRWDAYIPKGLVEHCEVARASMCPACGKAVRKIYRPGGTSEFRCRTCHRLTYAKAQRHDRSLDLLVRDPARLEAAVDGLMGKPIPDDWKSLVDLAWQLRKLVHADLILLQREIKLLARLSKKRRLRRSASSAH